MGENKGPILVVGGGIAGISTALEAAETGYDVILIEKRPSLGGRVAGFHQYFPKLCPPTCGVEINYQRLRRNRRIQVHTNTQVAAIAGEAGNFTVQLVKSPTYVNNKCVMCDKCTAVCPAEVPGDHDYGMRNTRAIHMPHRMAYPPRFVVERAHCPSGCDKCVSACPYDAIDLDMQAREFEVNPASIVMATGWQPYDASKLERMQFGALPNVITNVMMERLAATDGPTAGEITRPSDGRKVETVVFVQCAGSRDQEHLPYCSSVCCLASLKQANYVRTANPDARVYIFYIDIRTPGKFEAFYSRTRKDSNIEFIKGKVARVEAGEDGRVIVEAEDILHGGKVRVEVDLVVLATGMESNLKTNGLNGDIVHLDEDGFASAHLQQPGIFAAGVAQGPVDVNSSIQEATGVALKAIQVAAGE
ncbi:MAG: CoB--CoM heterodisulfide reductase iron-sulfur subunit A family protein [Gammaproteobacteria bacterium]|nr:CoB--CoM heterodisulfide reductase iron-sulfur subunit A family protein [Gammaproteobacteria bacterium]